MHFRGITYVLMHFETAFKFYFLSINYVPDKTQQQQQQQQAII